MFDAIVAHMNRVEQTIGTIDPRAAFAFALACTERQWPVLRRASIGKPWAPPGPSVLRQGVDLAWRHLIDGTPFSAGLPAQCAPEVPQPEDLVDGPAAAAHTIANSILDLLDAVEKADAPYCHHLSGRNIGLLEILRDEFEERGLAQARDVDELIVRELERQDRDLQSLGRDASPAAIEALRRDSTEVSLFGSLWFPL